MTLVKWTPFGNIEQLRRETDKLFGEFFGERGTRFPSEAGIGVPSIEIYDKGENIVFKAEVPGIEKDNIEITVTGDAITLKGEVKKEEEVKEENYYCAERRYGKFSRTAVLPVEVDASKAKAVFKNGVLTVTLPKREESKPKQIKVDVN